MPEIHVYHLSANGLQWVGREESTLDAFTRRLPRGLYTTFRTFDGGRRALGLKRHLDRLYHPLTQLGIAPAAEREGLRAALRQVAATFAPGECRLRPVLLLEGEAAGTFYLLAESFELPPAELYEKGVAVITVPIERRNPRLKATDFIASSAEIRHRLSESGAYEAIRVRLRANCPRGEALEGLTSNFYVLRDNTLITAREGILPGVTRQIVLRLARRLGLEMLYRAPCLEETFEEALLTSSSRGVVPVVRIDGQVVADGRPGPHTRRLIQAYEAYVARHAEMI
ncbi:MAG: aminotransferase class IV [Anaerolineales bacterium]